MKNQGTYHIENAGYQMYIRILFLFSVILWTSCQPVKEPFLLLEFQSEVEVSNYSKSLFFAVTQPVDTGKTILMGSRGDLFLLGEFLVQYRDTSIRKPLVVQETDSILFINGKITSISLSGKNSEIAWMKDLLKQDLSNLQTVSITSDTIGACLGDLKKLAAVRPDAGIVFSGEFNRLKEVLNIFHPPLILSPSLHQSDYGLLAALPQLKILIAEAVDSVMNEPLPAMPSLKQLVFTDLNQHAVITGDLLVNNRQIEKIGLANGGKLDLSFLRSLKNLRELVITQTDSLLNQEEINRHAELEVLVLAGKQMKIDPSVIRLPHLRWLAIPATVTQDEFNLLIKNHPGLEVVEIMNNDTISKLTALSGLPELTGLTLLDTVTDLQTVKTLKGLKYLSLPKTLLEDSLTRVELYQALPGTTIAANEGFCMGSGWLLLLLPLVLILRFGWRKRANQG